MFEELFALKCNRIILSEGTPNIQRLFRERSEAWKKGKGQGRRCDVSPHLYLSNRYKISFYCMHWGTWGTREWRRRNACTVINERTNNPDRIMFHIFQWHSILHLIISPSKLLKFGPNCSQNINDELLAERDVQPFLNTSTAIFILNCKLLPDNEMKSYCQIIIYQWTNKIQHSLSYKQCTYGIFTTILPY